jgi:hypothetical protein
MTTTRGFSTDDLYNGTTFNNLDDMQPIHSPKQRFPIVLRPDNQEYQNQGIGNRNGYQTSKS